MFEYCDNGEKFYLILDGTIEVQIQEYGLPSNKSFFFRLFLFAIGFLEMRSTLI